MSRLLVETLQDNEALLLRGFERFSRYALHQPFQVVVPLPVGAYAPPHSPLSSAGTRATRPRSGSTGRFTRTRPSRTRSSSPSMRSTLEAAAAPRSTTRSPSSASSTRPTSALARRPSSRAATLRATGPLWPRATMRLWLLPSCVRPSARATGAAAPSAATCSSRRSCSCSPRRRRAAPRSAT